jgi:hypothetical protein
MPSKSKDPYEILGIARDATLEQARKSFRLLARKYHPDRNPGDKAAEARFKDAEEAWTELEQVLPRSAVPLEIPDGASEQEIEDAYVKWLLDPKNQARRKPNEGASKREPEETKIWSTVAGEAASGKVARGDWRKVKIRRFRDRYGLEGISAEQAARLLDSHPNAFLVMKIVQQHAPELCLYDAVLSRASFAHVSREDSRCTAVVIVGADLIDEAACLRALQDPLATVDMAEEKLDVIAPSVKFGGASIPPNKLGLDVWFLREHIRELSAMLRKRNGQSPSQGTGIAPS